MQVGNRVRIRQDGGKEAQPQARTRPLCFVYLLMAFMRMVARAPPSAYGLPLARRKRTITQLVFKKALGALADGSGPGPPPGGTAGRIYCRGRIKMAGSACGAAHVVGVSRGAQSGRPTVCHM